MVSSERHGAEYDVSMSIRRASREAGMPTLDTGMLGGGTESRGTSTVRFEHFSTV